MENTNIENKANFKFAAINKQIENLIPKNVEIDSKNKWVYWGNDNAYPIFLYKMYTECSLLNSIINGSINYINGDEVTCNVGFKEPNPTESWYELIGKLAADILIFGEAYLQVVRNKIGNPTEFYWLDARYMRSDTKSEVFWYSEDFGKSYARTSKMIVYPKYVREAYDIPSSVICVKTTPSRDTYGTPIYLPAIKAVMTDVEISNFHLGEVFNNFNVSAIINFCQGIPSDEQADELEKSVQEKFCGSSNAARVMLSFSNGQENRTSVERLDVDNFADRYNTLSDTIKDKIFSCFGANQCLFGLNNQGTGFNEQEFESAYKLFYRSRIAPLQKRICDMFDRVFGVEGSISIKPFSIEKKDVEEEIVS